MNTGQEMLHDLYMDQLKLRGDLSGERIGVAKKVLTIFIIAGADFDEDKIVHTVNALFSIDTILNIALPMDNGVMFFQVDSHNKFHGGWRMF